MSVHDQWFQGALAAQRATNNTDAARELLATRGVGKVQSATLAVIADWLEGGWQRSGTTVHEAGDVRGGVLADIVACIGAFRALCSGAMSTRATFQAASAEQLATSMIECANSCLCLVALPTLGPHDSE